MPCEHPFPIQTLEAMRDYITQTEKDFAEIGVTTNCGHSLAEVAKDYGERFKKMSNGDASIAFELLGHIYQMNAIHAAALHHARTELLRADAAMNNRVQVVRDMPQGPKGPKPGALFDLGKKRR